MQITALQLLDDGPTLSVGIAAANLLKLGDESELLEGVGISVIQVDVMDGVFCPQMTSRPRWWRHCRTVSSRRLT